MDDPTILVTAIEAGRWPEILGAALIVVVSLVRLYLAPRLEGLPAGDWVSAVAGILGGLGVALVAGAIWWHALIACVLGAGTSAGLWRLLAACVPAARPKP